MLFFILSGKKFESYSYRFLKKHGYELHKIKARIFVIKILIKIRKKS